MEKNIWQDETNEDIDINRKEFWGTSRDEHKEWLEKSTIGRSILAFIKNKNISYESKDDFSEKTVALCLFTRGVLTMDPKHLEYGIQKHQATIQFNNKRTHPADFGHELRHAWQGFYNIEEKAKPKTLGEAIMVDRFIEADARAIELGLMVEMAAKDLTHKTNLNMLACLNVKEREILEYSFDKIKKADENPKLLNEIMRDKFDYWISIAPYQDRYDKNTYKKMDFHKQTTALYRALGLRPKIDFSSLEVSPQFMKRITTNLGQTPHGNFLTETKGLDFTHPFYTQIHNFRLEGLQEPKINQ